MWEILYEEIPANIWKTDLLGSGFPSSSLVQWSRSARTANRSCCTTRSPCWGARRTVWIRSRTSWWTKSTSTRWRRWRRAWLTRSSRTRQTDQQEQDENQPNLTLTWSGQRSTGSPFQRVCTCSCTPQDSPCPTSCSRTCALGTCNEWQYHLVSSPIYIFPEMILKA